MMAALQDRRFDPAILDQILDRTPLASLIGQNVALKRSGRAQAGCCPFHGERTPSFNVYEKHFHCFGCGEHGNAFDFVRKNDGVSFPEAVKRLAADAGVDLPQGAPRPASPAERAAQEAAAQERQRRIEAKAIADAREKDLREEAIAKQAERRWAKAAPAPADHPYLVRKEVDPDGLRVDAKGRLLVPMRDEEGKLWNLQTIPAKGKKITLWRRTADGAEGGRAQGLSDALGSLDGAPAVVVAEGRATGATVHEATGLPVRVAFSSGNLEHVVRALRERHPDLPIIVAADNDHHKERLTPPKENVGLVKAGKAVKDVPHAAVLAPQFDAASAGTDWNDYRAQHGAAPIRAAFDAKLSSVATLKQETPLSEQTTPTQPAPVAPDATAPAQAPKPATAPEAAASAPTPAAAPAASPAQAPAPVVPTPPAVPATVAELVAELGRRAAGNAKAEAHVAKLADEMRQRPGIEKDAQFVARVVEAARGIERGGVVVPMAQELRDLVTPAMPPSAAPGLQEPAGVTQGTARQAAQQGAAASNQVPAQPQNRVAGAIGSAMTQLFAALRPPTPATPPPWEQAPRPLGDRLEAFERRAAENAIHTQTQAAQKAGEIAQAALERLGTGPGGAIIGKIKEAAQNEPGGMPAVVAEMAPGGRFADLRTEFNAGLVQERAFASAYDRAVSGITEYGGARMRLNETLGKRQMDVTGINEQFEGMDRTIGQASEGLPGRKDGKSVRDDIAEKAAQLAEFLKGMVQRIGNAIRPAAAPAEAATAAPAPTPARGPSPTP